jgi:serine/threonine-protein kinase
MGEVFLAEDLLLKRRVAIKRVRRENAEQPGFMERIKRECVLHARVGVHPHMVSLFDRSDLDGDVLLVMEYVPGKSLRGYHTEHAGRVTVGTIVAICRQLLLALGVIHGHDIVHRDIKPENVLVIAQPDGSSPNAKLLDFGIARGGGEQSITGSGAGSPGTPRYMAPEQIDPETWGEPGIRSDLYAMGIMLHELLSGRTPFQGTFHEVLAGHLHRTPPPPIVKGGEHVPEGLAAVLRKALAKNPAERFATAFEMSEALAPFETVATPVAGLDENATGGAGTGGTPLLHSTPSGTTVASTTGARAPVVGPTVPDTGPPPPAPVVAPTPAPGTNQTNATGGVSGGRVALFAAVGTGAVLLFLAVGLLAGTAVYLKVVRGGKERAPEVAAPAVIAPEATPTPAPTATPTPPAAVTPTPDKTLLPSLSVKPSPSPEPTRTAAPTPRPTPLPRADNPAPTSTARPRPAPPNPLQAAALAELRTALREHRTRLATADERLRGDFRDPERVPPFADYQTALRRLEGALDAGDAAAARAAEADAREALDALVLEVGGL